MKKIKGLVIALGVILLLGVLLGGLYVAGLFPSFNEQVNQVLRIGGVPNGDATRNLELESLRQETAVGGLHPHLVPLTEEGAAAIRQSEQPLPPSSYLTPDSYSIAFFGGGMDGRSAVPAAVDGGNALWTYEGEYPVVASIAEFSDALVFIDAQPSLVCLDKETGAELLRLPCGVYPGGDAFARRTSYYFTDRAGDWYEIRFEPGHMSPDRLSLPLQVEDAGNLLEELHQSLLPGKTALDFINAKMNGILSVSPAAMVPESLLYAPEGEPVSFARELVSPALVFSPKEQGTYTLGLCNREGGWIRDNAFVVLYTMAGEALAISLDYVADRPQITTHLSDQELYIACAGFFPDSLIIDAGVPDDFRDGIVGTSTQGEHFSGETRPLEEEDKALEMEVIVLRDDSDGTGNSDTVEEPSRQMAWFQVRRAP